jgi:sec-independent protein translocase protein TatC
VSSVVLFYCGIAFAYFVVFPLLFAFFITVAPQGVAVMTDIGQFLDFVIAIFFAFGIAFEVPVATFLLVLAGATTPEQLAKKRPYIIVAAFVIGMVLTPPDVISQSLLAVPMWGLFEIGLLMSRLFIKSRESTNESGDEAEAEVTEQLFDDLEQEEEANTQRPD